MESGAAMGILDFFLQLQLLEVILFPNSEVKGAIIKTTKFLSIILIIILLGLTLYQVSRRIHWDLTSKNYSIATRYGDINKASSFYGETKMGLIEKLNRAGAQIILFSIDLSSETGSGKPDIIDELRKAGISRGVEISNLQLASQDDYRQILSYLETIQPKFVVLRGSSRAEPPSYIKNWLHKNDVILGTVEFRNSKTVETLVKGGDLDWVRLHRVFDKEVGTLTEVERKARYERAVQERNIGVIEYRLPLSVGLTNHLETLTSIRDRLNQSGYQVGPIEEAKGVGRHLKSSPWLIVALIATTFGLVLRSLTPKSISYPVLIIWISAVALVGFIGLTFLPILSRQIAALAVAVIAPLVGYNLLTKYGLSVRSSKSLVSPFLDLVWVSVLSTLAGLVVSSLLLDESFLLKLNQFRGVKVSLFFPLLLLVVAASYRDQISISKMKFDYKKGFLGAALIGLFLFLLFRSGNFTFLRSSDLEEAVRRWLENTLYVRPRFKEFVLGHPSLIVWLYLAGHYRKKLPFCKLGLLLVGFMGQVSIINTFAHIHTPVIVSLIRTGNGLAGGIILGAILLAIILGGEYVWNLRTG
ncbi:MAG: DUF5693 family protein [Candidatus Bipolaricaulia bacterium]